MISTARHRSKEKNRGKWGRNMGRKGNQRGEKENTKEES